MKLNRKIIGEGPPLVILHGVFGALDNWQTLGNEFARDHRVILVDQRNHGKSPHSDTFDYPTMSADLKRLLADEDISSAHILGHSMGGKTAMFFACEFPNLVDRLIIVDISPRYYPPHHQQIFEGFKSLDLTQIESRKQADQQLSEKIQNPGVRQFLLKNLQREGKEGFSWKLNLDAIEKNAENIGAALPEDYIFRGLTRFIGGDKSDYISEKDHQDIEHHFPESKIEMVADAGHWVHAEKPRALYQLVRDFLKE
jgi:pimeloyl-ACP methyl ester carboxylesterase